MNSFSKIISSKYTKWLYFLTSIFGFLILILLYGSFQQLFLGETHTILSLLAPFLVSSVLYFALVILLIIFSTKITLRWNYGLVGLTTSIGIAYLSLAPLQVFFNFLAANLKTDPGLAELVYFAPSFVIIQSVPLQVMIGFIGYRLGRREEFIQKVKLGQPGLTELEKDWLGTIFLDAFGIFFLGVSAIIGYQQIVNEIEKLGLLKFEGGLYFPLLTIILKYFSIPGFLYLGFYLPRLIAKKIWHEKIPSHTLFGHILALIFISILILLPIGSKTFANFVYKSRIQQLSSETKTVYLGENIVIDSMVVALPFTKAPRQLAVNLKISTPKTGTYFFDRLGTTLSYIEHQSDYPDKRLTVGDLIVVRTQQKVFDVLENGSVRVELGNGDQELTLIFSMRLPYKPENTYSFYQNQSRQLEVRVLAYPPTQQCTTCAAEPDTSTVFVEGKFTTFMNYSYKDFE